ncbi:MAG: J domain-containing protein [Actinomycetota bacterium]|nr:J domain-containing protein [Actinomycetota bacterium]
MLLAELEIRHSRAIAPTRRVALGDLWLPTEPGPGFGGILLAGIVAGNVNQLEDDLRDELDALVDDLERGARIAQPRLRHRFQTDVVGLDRSRHRLVGVGESMALKLDDHGAVLPQVLGAAYAASKLSYRARGGVFRLLRRATRWHAGNDERLIGYLTGDEASFRTWRTAAHDERWALKVLGFKPDADPTRSAVLAMFRRLVFHAHPDHGGASDQASARITELTQAKRILLADV